MLVVAEIARLDDDDRCRCRCRYELGVWTEIGVVIEFLLDNGETVRWRC